MKFVTIPVDVLDIVLKLVISHVYCPDCGADRKYGHMEVCRVAKLYNARPYTKKQWDKIDKARRGKLMEKKLSKWSL